MQDGSPKAIARTRLSEEERIERWRQRVCIPRDEVRLALMTPEFRAAWSKAIEEYYYLRLPLVYEKLWALVEKGNLRAIRLFLERFDPDHRVAGIRIGAHAERDAAEIVSRMKEMVAKVRASGGTISVQAIQASAEIQPDGDEANGCHQPTNSISRQAPNLPSAGR